jgi:nucleotide-binding universal stress UspA family protein
LKSRLTETAQSLHLNETKEGPGLSASTFMIDIKRILCPTDLSTDSDQALRYGLALTRAYESKLIICHRAADSERAGAADLHEGPAGNSLTQEKAKIFQGALLKFLAPQALGGLDWQALLIEGDDVGEAITRTASECAADLIVMRSRRRPHRAALLGSTAESVCRTAPCPVLVTHTDQRDWVQPLSKSISLQRVLVPYDFSDYSELALKYALSFAQEYQAELHLLHVLPPFSLDESEISWYPLGREGTYHKAAHRLQKAIPPEAHLWCNIKHAVTEGHPYREILGYAEKNKIDLICLGAHGAGFGMRALFGSNVDRVIRQAPCPVLVTRPLKPAMSYFQETETRVELALGR